MYSLFGSGSYSPYYLVIILFLLIILNSLPFCDNYIEASKKQLRLLSISELYLKHLIF